MKDRRPSWLLGLVFALTAAGCSQATTGPSTPPLSPDPAASTVAAGPTAQPSASTGSASPDASSGPYPSRTPRATPVAVVTEAAPRPTFPVGLLLTTVADRVRVRSKPLGVDGSVGFEPVLPIGTALHALKGPVAGSGYWWYRVALMDGQTLLDGVTEGWVAATARDGTPWLGALKNVDPGPPLPAVKSDWPEVHEDDVSFRGDPPSNRKEALEIRVEIRGRLPGSVVFVTASGDYTNSAWYCGGGTDSETGVGSLTAEPVSGSAKIETRITVGPRGVGRATIRLPADVPSEACPAANPDGPFPMKGRWSHVGVTLPEFGLRLTPPPFSWADTF